MKKEETKSQLDRLIREAPLVAPSIVRYNDARTYGTVTDEGLDAQAMQRWELEATALLNQLANSGADVFRQLHSRYVALMQESQEFHSKSILVHRLLVLLTTASELLDSPFNSPQQQSQPPLINFPTMSAIWTWLRKPKNLAVLTALGSSAAYLISLAIKPEHPQTPTPSQPAVVISPQIHIENKPSNVISVLPQSQSVATQAASSAAEMTSPPVSPLPASALARFPVRRNAGVRIPVEMFPGFSVTVASIFGIEGHLKVGLESAHWGGAERDFPVGSPPIDITVKGSIYRLSVESADQNSALIVLDHGRP